MPRLVAPRTDAVPIEAKTDRAGNPTGGGGGQGSEDAPAAKLSRKKPKKDPNAVVVAVSDIEGQRIFYNPCNLKRVDPESEEESFFQDWVVVLVAPTEEGAEKRFECRKRMDTGAPSAEAYPVTDTNEWLRKMQEVRNAMVNGYVEYNFRAYLEKLGGTALAEATVFCHAEANRLVPQWEDAIDPTLPSWTAPVQYELYKIQEPALKRRFNPSNDGPARNTAYTWSVTPLKINNTTFAFDRLKSCYKTAAQGFNLNLAIPNHVRMFPEQEHKAILQGMERKPSEVQTVEGNTAQTWAYNRKANQMVDHATYEDGGEKASPEEQDGFRENFESTRQLMITAFLDKWFPTEDTVVTLDDGSTVDFGYWCKDNGFDPTSEANAMIPIFNQTYGFQHYSPGTSPGSTMTKKKQNIAVTAYDFKGDGGFAGITSRFKYLTKAIVPERKKGSKGKKVFVGTPLDVLWVEDEIAFYNKYKDLAKPKKEKKGRPKREKKPKKQKSDSMESQVLAKIPGESYLRLLVETYQKRQAREKEYKAAIDKIRQRLKGDDKKDARNDAVTALKAEQSERETEIRATENEDLDTKKKALVDETTTPNLSAQVTAEEAELFLKLNSDQERFSYLRTKYYIDLKVYDEIIRSKPKPPKKLKTRTDAALESAVVVDLDDDEDMGIPAEAGIPSDSMDVTPSPAYSSSTEELVSASDRDEISFAYLDSIKRVLQDSEKAKQIYEYQLAIMLKNKKTEQAKMRFEEYAAMTPDQRNADREARSAAKKTKAPKAKKPKLGYDQLDFAGKMVEDARIRAQRRNKYKKSTEKLKQFDSYAALLVGAMLVETDAAKELRSEELYKVMYGDWTQTKNQRESNTFHTMAKAVLQYFYLEFDEYRKLRRDEALTPEERKKEQENMELKESTAAFKKALKQGDTEEAMKFVYKDHAQEAEADEQERQGDINAIVADYTDKLSIISADGEKMATFDRGEFATELMKELTAKEKEHEKIKKNTFNTYTEMEGKIRGQPDEIVAEKKAEYEESMKRASETRVRDLLKNQTIAELVGADALALLTREEERKQSTQKAREERKKLLDVIYSSIVEAGSSNANQVLAMRVAVSQQDIAQKIEEVENLDEEARRQREKDDYAQNVSLRGNALLASLNRFLLDVQRYNATNNSETLQPFFQDKSMKRASDPLKEGLSVETLAEAVLSPDMLQKLPKLPVMKKPQKKSANQYINEAVEWQKEQMERKWFQKDRAGKSGLDPENEDDALDLKYMYDADPVYESDVVLLERTQESNFDFERLWEVLGQGRTKAEFKADMTAAFHREQKVNAAAGLVSLEPTLANIVDFLVVKRVGFSQNAKKALVADTIGESKGNIRINKLRYFSIDNFKGRDKIGFANSRLEQYMKPNDDGEWTIVKYDEDFVQDDEGTRFKRAEVLHFYEDDLDAIPDTVWAPVMKRIYKNHDPSSNEQRYSIYNPPDDEEDDEGREAWDAAKKAYEFARESISIDEFVEDGRRTKEEAIAAVEEFATYGLLTWDSTKETISNIKLPEYFKSAPNDTPEDKIEKAEGLKHYKRLRQFLARYYQSVYEEDADDIEEIEVDKNPADEQGYTSQPDISDDEEDEDDEEEEEDDEEEQEEEDIDNPQKRPEGAFGALSDDDDEDDSDEDDSDEEYVQGKEGSDDDDDDDEEDYFDEGAAAKGEGEEEDEEEGEEEDEEEEDDDDDDESAGGDTDDDEPVGSKRKQKALGGSVIVPSASDEVVEGLATAFESSAAVQSKGSRQWWGSSASWWKSNY